MGKALILTDGKAGHENQSKAFARALGCDYDLMEIHFKSKFHKALSYLLDRLGIRTLALLKSNNPTIKQEPVAKPCEARGRISVKCAERENVVRFPKVHFTEMHPRMVLQLPQQSNNQTIPGIKQSNNPTIQQSNNPYAAVLGTGSGTFYAAKAVARRLGVKCGVVLYPRGYDVASFDCILAPSFDRPAKAANVVEIPANLVANDADFYEKGVAAFRVHYGKSVAESLPSGEAGTPPLRRCGVPPHHEDGRIVDSAPNAVAVIVGGPNKCSTMTPEWMKSQLDVIFKSNNPTIQQSNNSRDQAIQQSNNPTIQQSNNSQFWVTTSRRTPPAVEAVVDSYPWDYKLLYSKDHFNPIPAFVKLAKKLYVTAESTGMLSEACTFGTAEVVALDNLNPGPHKFRRFVENLRAAGYVDGNRKVDLSAQFAAARRLMGL